MHLGKEERLSGSLGLVFLGRSGRDQIWRFHEISQISGLEIPSWDDLLMIRNVFRGEHKKHLKAIKTKDFDTNMYEPK